MNAHENSVVYALEQARELIRMGWCQMHSAKDARGRAVFCHSEAAIQFDLGGAVARVTWPWDEDESTELWELTQDCFVALQRAIEASGWEDDRPVWHVLNDWNDDPERTKEEVVALIGAAVELLRGGS
jgi:hypothetical protein